VATKPPPKLEPRAECRRFWLAEHESRDASGQDAHEALAR
jgi:hypothetical protein